VSIGYHLLGMLWLEPPSIFNCSSTDAAIATRASLWPFWCA